MAIDGKKIYNELDQWRRKEGLSWGEAAGKVGVNVSDIENLKSPLWRTTTVEKACKALGQTPASFDPSAGAGTAWATRTQGQSMVDAARDQAEARADRSMARPPW